MNKEAEKIAWANKRLPLAKWLYKHDKLLVGDLHYAPWNKIPEEIQRNYCYLAGEIMRLSYRLIPELPLLSDEEIEKVIRKRFPLFELAEEDEGDRKETIKELLQAERDLINQAIEEANR